MLRTGLLARTRGGGAYIIGEKPRSGSAEAKAALSRQGRYKTVTGNLQVKEVRLPDAGDRFIICFNPDQAVRDAAVRAKVITALEETIAGSDELSATKRAELRGKISMMPGQNRFLRVTPGGLLRTDGPRAKAEGEPRRQVPAAQRRPGHDRRGHHRRLQAAP